MSVDDYMMGLRNLQGENLVKFVSLWFFSGGCGCIIKKNGGKDEQTFTC